MPPPTHFQPLHLPTYSPLAQLPDDIFVFYYIFCPIPVSHLCWLPACVLHSIPRRPPFSLTNTASRPTPWMAQGHLAMGGGVSFLFWGITQAQRVSVCLRFVGYLIDGHIIDVQRSTGYSIPLHVHHSIKFHIFNANFLIRINLNVN